MESDLPPPYEANAEDDAQADPILEPAIFLLAGQTIHIETVDSPPAYELSRGVANLTRTTEKVTFERVDQTIRSTTGSSGAAVPTVALRRRHLYDLRRAVTPPRISLSRKRRDDSPEYFIQRMSRRALGHLGLCASGRRRGEGGAGLDAVPVYMETGRARYADWKPPLFRLRLRRGDGDDGARRAWSAAGDEAVVAVEDGADGEHRLIFTMALPRRDVDALVALWCCSIWQEAAAQAGTFKSISSASKS